MADVRERGAVTPPSDLGERAAARNATWAATMHGHARHDGVCVAHRDGTSSIGHVGLRTRAEREAAQDLTLAPGATRARGAGSRAAEEEPDPYRTCFERDRDRILHSTAFRRLAGKTQVFVFPDDHQRTRLTHALEVAQVATAVARTLGLNVELTEAIALGHDCGHGPGGHASEDAFSAFVPGGYDHALWGADVVLEPLNLTVEVLDGIRNHSWSRPAPATPEGEVVSWADRIAYSAHDLEDAAAAGLVELAALPRVVREVAGTTRSAQLSSFITAMVDTAASSGVVGMDAVHADALAALREFNYEHVYTREAAASQGAAVAAMLSALVEHFATAPGSPVLGAGLEPGGDAAVRAAVTYVAGMTDRFACACALTLLRWRPEDLPRGVDLASIVPTRARPIVVSGEGAGSPRPTR